MLHSLFYFACLQMPSLFSRKGVDQAKLGALVHSLYSQIAGLVCTSYTMIEGVSGSLYECFLSLISIIATKASNKGVRTYSHSYSF